ncbi:19486_t:CDS:10, partial [Dentiscutata erythropus]
MKNNEEYSQQKEHIQTTINFSISSIKKGKNKVTDYDREIEPSNTINQLRQTTLNFSSSIIHKECSFNKIDTDLLPINDNDNEITDDNKSDNDNNLDEYSNDEYNEFSLDGESHMCAKEKKLSKKHAALKHKSLSSDEIKQYVLKCLLDFGGSKNETELASQRAYASWILDREDLLVSSAKCNDKLKALYGDAIENSNESQMWLKLSEYVKKGVFKPDKIFSELVELMLQIKEIQEHGKSKRGLQYSEHLYHFFSLLSDSSREYSIFHKMLDGPVVAMTDCTKIRAKLTYSQELECIIRSTLNIEDTNILTYKDIHLKIKEIQDNNLVTSQVRCVVLKIPISKIFPVVIALLSTKGSDTTQEIFTILKKITLLMQGSDTQEFLVYENMIYNIRFQAPIYSRKSIIRIQDPKHAKKNGRNAIHSGARLLVLGNNTYGTEALEHLFGIARQLMPDFSYYELYKILNRVQYRDNILRSENILDTQEKKSASGYIFDFNTSISEIDIDKLQNWLSNDEINDAIRIAYENANLFSNLLHMCKKLKDSYMEIDCLTFETNNQPESEIFQIQTIDQAADKLKRISQLDDAFNICFGINNDDTSENLNEFVQDLLEVNITEVENFIEKTEINYINNNSYSKVSQELDYEYEEKIFRDNGSCDIFLMLELQKSHEAFSHFDCPHRIQTQAINL